MRLAALALAALVALPAAAADGRATVTVTGTATVNREPDMATLSAGVETMEDSAEAALAANAEAMQAVIVELKAAGLSEGAIGTRGLSVAPVRGERYSSNGAGEIEGYRAINTVTARTRDLDSLGALIDALARAGANRLDNLSFALSDPTDARAEARAEAMAEARAAAEAYAAAEGLKPGEVRAISEGGSPSPAPRMRAMAAESTATPIARGEIGVSASVRVIWTLEPAEE